MRFHLNEIAAKAKQANKAVKTYLQQRKDKNVCAVILVSNDTPSRLRSPQTDESREHRESNYAALYHNIY